MAEGKTRREIVRCIKRFFVRKIFNAVCRPKFAADCRLATVGAPLLWG